MARKDIDADEDSDEDENEVEEKSAKTRGDPLVELN